MRTRRFLLEGIGSRSYNNDDLQDLRRLRLCIKGAGGN